MPSSKVTLLPERGILLLSGDDAQSFLQGIITNDIDTLELGQSLFAGLLMPQGKLLFDFFVVRTEAGFLIDVAEGKTEELAKRLSFYKLRAKVEIEDLSDEMIVGAIWAGREKLTCSALYDDPRLPELGQRFISEPQQFDTNADERDYSAHRIALGIPEGGKDFEFGNTFPHEVNMDVLHGVDFNKGCYVGQEVVSRMQHRGNTRKRVVPVASKSELPQFGSEIRAGSALIGTLGSSMSKKGLALIRLDRAAEAIEKNVPLTAGDVTISLTQPDWAPFTVPTA